MLLWQLPCGRHEAHARTSKGCAVDTGELRCAAGAHLGLPAIGTEGDQGGEGEGAEHRTHLHEQVQGRAPDIPHQALGSAVQVRTSDSKWTNSNHSITPAIHTFESGLLDATLCSGNAQILRLNRLHDLVSSATFSGQVPMTLLDCRLRRTSVHAGATASRRRWGASTMRRRRRGRTTR